MKHSLFWAAVEAGAKAARSGLSTVGALVDCGIPRQPGAQWLTAAEEEIDAWEPHQKDGDCCTFHEPAHFDDDDEPIGYWCLQCRESYGEGERCSCLQTPAHSASATAARVVEEGLTEETPPVSSVSAAINYRGEQLSWCEYVTPAILDVLASHRPSEFHRPAQNAIDIYCRHDDGSELYCDDLYDWREHVAPLIAERLEAVTLALPEM